MNTIPIFLSEEEARRFILFNKYYKVVCALEDLGMEALKNGSVTIHFDNIGKMRSVEKKEQWNFV